MPNYTQEDRNGVMACYASDLIHGVTIKAIAIKVDTIKRYLYAAAAFSLARQVIDPRLDICGKPAHHLEKILKSHKHWEDIPNRREPVTERMLQKMFELNPGDDSLDAALSDWNVMGHHYGFRKSEWVQDSKDLRKKEFQRIPNGEVQAFRRSDFTYISPDGTRISQNDQTILDEDDPNIDQVSVCWRYQKNGDNGQSKTHKRNLEHPELCAVRASLRIRRRSQICGGNSHDPMALFRNNRTGHAQFISDKHVESHLQRVAKTVYQISDKKDLSRWTCHSVRVGACVSLFNQEKGEAFIQFQLRWRSQSWRDYIRDSPTLSDQHIKASNANWDAMLEQQNR